MTAVEYIDYGFKTSDASHMHGRFMPEVLRLAGVLKRNTRVLDVGCGNGFTCGQLAVEPPDSQPSARGNRVSEPAVSRCRTRSAALDDHGDVGR